MNVEANVEPATRRRSGLVLPRRNMKPNDQEGEAVQKRTLKIGEPIGGAQSSHLWGKVLDEASARMFVSVSIKSVSIKS